MDKMCNHCNSKNFHGERTSICCSNGKISLQTLANPTPIIKSLLDGKHSDSQHFIQNARRYNNAFSMTSFSAKSNNSRGWTPTLKIHGQIHHTI